MSKVILALCLSSAAAFVAPQASKAAVSVGETKADLDALANELNPIIGFWDPLGATGLDFWGLGNEGTIGYLRHAEIKHGRIAMAGFLGYVVQSTPFVSGPHSTLPFPGYTAGLTPPEQWDAIPLIGKAQILVAIGMLESYGEILPVHYTKGGQPGYYPPIKGNRPELILNLYDPFDFFESATAEEKEAGLVKEINNGRLAMLGLFSLLSAASAPGSVPILDGIVPAYAGNVMIPFEGQFSFFGAV